MSVLGIIAEYNPFHNGHLHHLEQARSLTGAHYTVCVMSGNFIQRGEPALINKWSRTKAAVMSGIDLVIELPVVYSMASAEFFAFGGVKLLDSLGIVDCLCFGSENGSTVGLDEIAGILLEEPESYRKHLREHLKKGLSYPASRNAALIEYLSRAGSDADSLEEIMRSSNNILGIEYLKALKRLGSTIKPVTIKRIKSTYNSPGITDSIASATAVRRNIFDNPKELDIDTLKRVIPENMLSILKEELVCGRGPVFPDMYGTLLLGLARKMCADDFARLPYVSEGLENRLKAASLTSGSIDEYLGKVCTKRYTRTRIQRILFSILTGLEKNEFDEFNKFGGPQYIRVLGFNSKGRELLSKIKKSATLPVMVKPADYKNSCNPLLRRMLEIEANTTDIYVLAYGNTEFRGAGQEFTQNLVRL